MAALAEPPMMDVLLDKCACGNVFVNDAIFCRKCGSKRGATNFDEEDDVNRWDLFLEANHGALAGKVDEPRTLEIAYTVERGQVCHEIVYEDPTESDKRPRLLVSLASVLALKALCEREFDRVELITDLLKKCRTAYYKDICGLREQVDRLQRPNAQGDSLDSYEVYWYNPPEYLDHDLKIFLQDCIRMTNKKLIEENFELIQKLKQMGRGGIALSDDDTIIKMIRTLGPGVIVRKLYQFLLSPEHGSQQKLKDFELVINDILKKDEDSDDDDGSSKLEAQIRKLTREKERFQKDAAEAESLRKKCADLEMQITNSNQARASGASQEMARADAERARADENQAKIDAAEQQIGLLKSQLQESQNSGQEMSQNVRKISDKIDNVVKRLDPKAKKPSGGAKGGVLAPIEASVAALESCIGGVVVKMQEKSAPKSEPAEKRQPSKSREMELEKELKALREKDEANKKLQKEVEKLQKEAQKLKEERDVEAAAAAEAQAQVTAAVAAAVAEEKKATKVLLAQQAANADKKKDPGAKKDARESSGVTGDENSPSGAAKAKSARAGAADQRGGDVSGEQQSSEERPDSSERKGADSPSKKVRMKSMKSSTSESLSALDSTTASASNAATSGVQSETADSTVSRPSKGSDAQFARQLSNGGGSGFGTDGVKPRSVGSVFTGRTPTPPHDSRRSVVEYSVPPMVVTAGSTGPVSPLPGPCDSSATLQAFNRGRESMIGAIGIAPRTASSSLSGSPAPRPVHGTLERASTFGDTFGESLGSKKQKALSGGSRETSRRSLLSPSREVSGSLTSPNRNTDVSAGPGSPAARTSSGAGGGNPFLAGGNVSAGVSHAFLAGGTHSGGGNPPFLAGGRVSGGDSIPYLGSDGPQNKNVRELDPSARLRRSTQDTRPSSSSAENRVREAEHSQPVRTKRNPQDTRSASTAADDRVAEVEPSHPARTRRNPQETRLSTMAADERVAEVESSHPARTRRSPPDTRAANMAAEESRSSRDVSAEDRSRARLPGVAPETEERTRPRHPSRAAEDRSRARPSAPSTVAEDLRSTARRLVAEDGSRARPASIATEDNVKTVFSELKRISTLGPEAYSQDRMVGSPHERSVEDRERFFSEIPSQMSPQLSPHSQQSSGASSPHRGQASRKLVDPLSAHPSTSSAGSTAVPPETSITSSTSALSASHFRANTSKQPARTAKASGSRSQPARSLMSAPASQPQERSAPAISIRTGPASVSDGFARRLSPANNAQLTGYSVHSSDPTTGAGPAELAPSLGFPELGELRSNTQQGTRSLSSLSSPGGSPQKSKRTMTAGADRLSGSRSVGSLPLTNIVGRAESTSPTKPKQHFNKYDDDAPAVRGHLPVLLPEFKAGKVHKGPLGLSHTWFVQA